MEAVLAAVCAVLVAAICLLIWKLVSLRRAAAEIRAQFAARLREDTNVGIDITSADPAMRALAADIDRQLGLLRREHLRYVRGGDELKAAITNIAHDLRTPLTAICGYMDLLEQEDCSEQVKRYLGIIANRIDALRQLTEELFRYSVAVSVPHDGGKEAVVLNHAIEECVAAHHGVLKERGIVPDICLPDVRVERQLNAAALSRILGNVLHNAAKYSDGDLSIRLSEQGVITIRNHAAELDEVTVGRLFDRFYTVENGQNGTGLGLSIAKALTEQMGGHITASKEDGMYTVRIAFPS